MDEDELLRLGNHVMRACGLGEDPFQPSPYLDVMDGEVRLGRISFTGAPFGLDRHDLGQHTLITGRSGAGKTTLIYIMLIQLSAMGVPFFAFDAKQDYRHLLGLNIPVMVFNAFNFRFNPLRPPIGVDPKVWLRAFTNVFCQSYFLLGGTKGLLLDHIDRLYSDYNAYSGSDTYPTFLDLQESLRRHKLQRQYGRIAGFLESAQNRVDECVLCMQDMTGVDRGFSIEELLGHNVVFELDGMTTEDMSFLISIILRYVFQYRISNGHRGGFRHIFLFDEAKLVFNRQKENQRELGFNEVAKFTSQIREFGEGLIVADQMPSALSDSIKSNVLTMISLSQAPGQVPEIVRALGLKTEEQVYALEALMTDRHQGIFQAIAKVSGRWAAPFIFDIEPFHLRKQVTDRQVRSLMRPKLGQLENNVKPRTEYSTILQQKRAEKPPHEKPEQRKKEERQEKAKEEGPEPEGNLLIQFLTNIRDNPFIDSTARPRMLGINSTNRANRIWKELEGKGYIRKVSFSKGYKKGRMTLYEITEKGLEFARMKPFKIPGKGGLEHKYWQHVIRDYFRKLGYYAEIERLYGPKNVDVGIEKDGFAMAVEIELTKSNLIRNVQLDLDNGIQHLIIAVRSTKARNSYKEILERTFTESKLSKVTFQMLSEFLE